jgi:hypothetical protein
VVFTVRVSAYIAHIPAMFNCAIRLDHVMIPDALESAFLVPLVYFGSRGVIA